MDPRVKHYELGDCSAHRRAGSRTSERVQRELQKSFTEKLDECIPEGAIVGEQKALNSAWSFRVGFRDKKTDTDAYRRNIKEDFPDARVSSIDRGDEWTVPYVEGVSSGRSPILSFLMTIFVFLCIFGILWSIGILG
jgi:hypothetical protein